MAKDESSTFFNPPIISEIVSSLRIRDEMLQSFHCPFYDEYFWVCGNSVKTSINVILKIKWK